MSTSNNPKIIGFVGCYSHDLILLLAKALFCVGKKVLVEDRNVNHTLSASVPVPLGLSSAKEIISYDGISFTETEVSDNQRKAYHFVLIDFGMAVHWEISKCNNIYLISDRLPHHLRKLKELNIPQHLVGGILIRDAVETGNDNDPDLCELMAKYSNLSTVFLKPDVRDIRNRVVCETLCDYRIKNASEQMQELVGRFTLKICGEIDEKELWKRIRRQERRSWF